MIDDAAASLALVLYLLFFAIPLYFEIRRKSMGFKEVSCEKAAELLPCPHCGSDDVGPIAFKGCNGDVWDEFIMCGECGATAETVEAWNMRAERTCRIVKASRKYVLSDGTELFEDGCSECNTYIGEGDNYCSNCGAKVIE